MGSLPHRRRPFLSANPSIAKQRFIYHIHTVTSRPYQQREKSCRLACSESTLDTPWLLFQFRRKFPRDNTQDLVKISLKEFLYKVRKIDSTPPLSLSHFLVFILCSVFLNTTLFLLFLITRGALPAIETYIHIEYIPAVPLCQLFSGLFLTGRK